MAEKDEDLIKSLQEKNLEQSLYKARKIFLWSDVNDESAKAVVTRLLSLDTENPDEEIVLYINSPGGSVHDVLWKIPFGSLGGVDPSATRTTKLGLKLASQSAGHSVGTQHGCTPMAHPSNTAFFAFGRSIERLVEVMHPLSRGVVNFAGDASVFFGINHNGWCLRRGDLFGVLRRFCGR